jgi:hypothetical protein
VTNNGPGPMMMEEGTPNGHKQPVSPMKRVLLRTPQELAEELQGVVCVRSLGAGSRRIVQFGLEAAGGGERR